MIVLAIDPGTEKLGISLLKDDGILGMWYVSLTPKDIGARYKGIFRVIQTILDEIREKPDYYAIETPFFSRNMATTIKLGTTRGVIMGCIFRKDIQAEIVDVNPVEVRNNLGLKKNADKKECHRIAKLILGNSQVGNEIHEDVLDSLGIGLAALTKIKQMKLDESAKIRTKGSRGKRRVIRKTSCR